VREREWPGGGCGCGLRPGRSGSRPQPAATARGLSRDLSTAPLIVDCFFKKKHTYNKKKSLITNRPSKKSLITTKFFNISCHRKLQRCRRRGRVQCNTPDFGEENPSPCTFAIVPGSVVIAYRSYHRR
jgi:hypothetical protein